MAIEYRDLRQFIELVEKMLQRKVSIKQFHAAAL